ncbi:tRNA methyltransferase, partial [Binucleata daphniae]
NIINSEEIESKHVQKFYNTHSDAFAKTRNVIWPITKIFLSENTGLILDAGSGNGRSATNKHIIALDQSVNLLKHNKCYTRIESNIVDLPFKCNTFDAVLSIAVIHHLATKNRRLKALQEIKRVLKPNGKCLIYVWNIEYINNKKFTNITGNDYFVKWGQLEDERYYHMYDIYEFCEDIIASGLNIIESGKEQESLYAIVYKNV